MQTTRDAISVPVASMYDRAADAGAGRLQRAMSAGATALA